MAPHEVRMRADRAFLALEILYWYFDDSTHVHRHPKRLDHSTCAEFFHARKRYRGIADALHRTRLRPAHTLLKSASPSERLLIFSISLILEPFGYDPIRTDRWPLVHFLQDIESERITIEDFREVA